MAMDQAHRQQTVMKKNKKKDEENEDEMALASADGNQGSNNNDRGGSGGGKFNGNCNQCGKKGHKAIDCWENPKNAHKRPKWCWP